MEEKSLLIKRLENKTENFFVLFKEAIQALNMTRESMHINFNASTSTIDRWMSGSAVPAPVLQELIYSFLIQELKNGQI